MANLYVGWTLAELRSERRKVQDLLRTGQINRLEENGQTTQFSKQDQRQALQDIQNSIALLDGATEAEIAEATTSRPGRTKPVFQ